MAALFMRRLAAAASVVLLLAAIAALVARDDGEAVHSILESSGDANADARKELLAYSNVLSFGHHIPDRSCEGCTDDQVHDDHPAEMTESLTDNSKWAHRFMSKGELYHGQNSGKAAVGADCYYTHTVAWCNAQNAGGMPSRAAAVMSKADRLSQAEKKEQALAMDGANDYDMDCFYHHEVSWCLKLHAKQKAAREKNNFVTNAVNRDSAYGSDPELAGLAKMVHSSEPAAERREDSFVAASHDHSRREAQEAREAREEEKASAARRARREEREAHEEREERKERKEREARQEEREQLQARAQHDEGEQHDTRRRREARAENANAGSLHDSTRLRELQEEAAREKEVAKQELQEQLAAEQKEAAAEAELKAAKAQLHALATKKKSDHQERVLPTLQRLPVEPSFQNAEPVEARPKREMVVAHAVQQSEAADRESHMQRLHREYEREMRAKEDVSYPLSVRKQEPVVHQVISSSIAWDRAHGVRPIDSLEQERRSRAMELADVRSPARSQKLADFTVSHGDVPGARNSDQPSQLEREALRDGLTLVPLAKSTVKSSLLVHKGLSADSQWESRAGLKPVSSKGSSRQSHPSSGLPSQDLLKSEERIGDDWERRQNLIPFTNRKDDRSRHPLYAAHAERVLTDERARVNPVSQAGSTLVQRADAEARQVGPSGIKALGFTDAQDFERHLEKEGI